MKPNAPIKNIIFDADGTLLHGENPYMEIAKKLECHDIVHGWVKDYLNDRLDYDRLVDMEVEIFKAQYEKIYGEKPRSGSFERLINIPEIREGVEIILDQLNKAGVKPFILSSGFRYIINELTKVHIDKDNIYANRFLYDLDGEFVDSATDVKGDKIATLDKILSDHSLNINETAYIGDNAFDKKLFLYILDKGGYVFMLRNSDSVYELEGMPKNEKYIEIGALSELLEWV